ncbi:MAG: peptidase [Chloroflexia bacterium]|nr:peptidase [Chloroflexia bacterium]
MDIQQRLDRFAPVALTAERKDLDPAQWAMVQRLIEAGRLLGQIHLRQIDPANLALRQDLAASDDPQDRLRRRLFDLMAGPWDRYADDEPFVGDRPRSPGGDFYPADMSKLEFEAWLEGHPVDRGAFQGYFSVIRRRGPDLVARPYHQVYREWLEPAAEALSSAAALSDHGALSDYLSRRAQALLDDDYFESDCLWVALQDGPIEALFGPYELYEDKLFGYKAAYQAMVGLRDLQESARFHDLVDYLPTMAAHLPVEKAYQGRAEGLASPIVVADAVYSAGLLATVGIPVAFVLPNDRRVRTAVGTKKVMLKNIIRAKFEHIVQPIAEQLLDREQVDALAFEPDFVHVLLHEISHALGAQVIEGPEGPLPVHQSLQDLYSTIEECKAEIVGLYNVLFLVREGFFPSEWADMVPVAYLANIFRLTRRGGRGAHARANLLAFNFFQEAAAVRHDAGSGRFRIDPKKTAAATKELAAILLRLEGRGDYGAAKALVDRYVRLPDVLGRSYEGLADIPLDLAPTYPWAEE